MNEQQLIKFVGEINNQEKVNFTKEYNITFLGC